MDESERLRLPPEIEGVQYSLLKHVRQNSVLNRQEYIKKHSGKDAFLNLTPLIPDIMVMITINKRDIL